jgi:PAS domain S-box-containing protein
MIDHGARAARIDASMRPGVPPDPAHGSVFRTRWARRWAMVVVVLMLAWTALAWQLDAQRYRARVDRSIAQGQAQARARAALVEDGLRQNLAQLDGVAHVLARMPEVTQTLGAAGTDADSLVLAPSALRERLQRMPRLADMNAFLATSAEDLGADLMYLLDGSGICVASSNAGSVDSVVGEHLLASGFFNEARARGSSRMFGVGSATGIPGMYFASAVTQQGRFIGAVVVKRNARALAAMVGLEGAFVLDSQGVVILAQDPRLQLQALEGAPVFRLDPAERAVRYQSDHLAPLRISNWDADSASPLRRIGVDPRPQAIVQRHLAREGLDVYVAQPLPEVEALRHEHLLDFVLLAVAGDGAIALIAAGLGGWRSRRSVLDAVDRIALANRSLSVEIAERQRAEGLLRESREFLLANEARLRALLRSLPEQVWMKDRSGAYLAVNAEFERFRGQREADLLGKTDHDIPGFLRVDHFALQDQATLTAAEPLVFHEDERPADGGGMRQLEVTKTAVRDERGNVIGVVGVARDMTAYNAAQRALRTSEARFRATFETAGDAILIIRKWLVADCNRRAAEMLGARDREDLIGRAMGLFAPERQPDGRSSQQLLAPRVSGLRSGDTRTFEWHCRRLDGSEFDAEITVSVFKHEGHYLLQAVLRDVSERRRMIAALEAARDEAERANRSKSVFLANMSHEIRTPLNAVLGFTQLLMSDRKLPGETQSRLRVIHSAGNRLLGLINDVLDLAKIESGGLQVVRAPFDLLQELRDIGHLYAAPARGKGIALQSELALAAPTVVDGDRNKVGQIVSNLLGNALKFTERGHVGLHVWRETADDERVWFEIVDTGPGISATDLAELFVPFRQGAAGREKGGTGLGLALSLDMARAMGGDLEVASTPGVGTQVRLWLPLPPSGAAQAGAVVGTGAQVLAEGTACTVLVIEDDPDSREVLVDLLREAGCTVTQAFDGLEGLACCRAQRFDIVFSDIRMPNLNGVEMMERLRADPATRELAVIAVSASSLEHERRFYIEAGFQEFIGKPYAFQQVYRALVEFAGVRLVATDPAPPRDAEPAPPPAGGLAPAVRERLRELADAASRGRLADVGRLMETLTPQSLGAERRRGFDEAARAYDFQLLERRVRDVLRQAEADG